MHVYLNFHFQELTHENPPFCLNLKTMKKGWGFYLQERRWRQLLEIPRPEWLWRIKLMKVGLYLSRILSSLSLVLFRKYVKIRGWGVLLKKGSGLKFRKIGARVRYAIALCDRRVEMRSAEWTAKVLPKSEHTAWVCGRNAVRIPIMRLHSAPQNCPSQNPKGNMRRLCGPHIRYAITYWTAYLASNSTNTLTHFAAIMRSAYLLCDRILGCRIAFPGKQYFLTFHNIDQYQKGPNRGSLNFTHS